MCAQALILVHGAFGSAQQLGAQSWQPGTRYTCTLKHGTARAPSVRVLARVDNIIIWELLCWRTSLSDAPHVKPKATGRKCVPQASPATICAVVSDEPSMGAARHRSRLIEQDYRAQNTHPQKKLSVQKCGVAGVLFCWTGSQPGMRLLATRSAGCTKEQSTNRATRCHVVQENSVILATPGLPVHLFAA